MLAAGSLLTFHSAVSERQFFPMGTFCCCIFGQFNDAFVFFLQNFYDCYDWYCDACVVIFVYNVVFVVALCMYCTTCWGVSY